MNKRYLKEKQDREIEMVLEETSSMQVWLFDNNFYGHIMII